MKDRNFHMHDGKTGAAITVRVTQRASHNEIIEVLDDGTIHVRLTSTQQEEKANQALVAFLAEVLGVKPAQVEVVAGLSGNDKLVTITGVDANTVHDRIVKSIS